MPHFYHITATDNVDSILANGLRGSTQTRLNVRSEKLTVPSIFALVKAETWLTDHVAITQLWPFQDIGNYAVITINGKGIRNPVVPDDVAEYTAPLHAVIEQDLVEPKFLKLRKIRELNFPHHKIQEILRAMGNRKWSKAEWQIARQWLKNICPGQTLYESGKISGESIAIRETSAIGHEI